MEKAFFIKQAEYLSSALEIFEKNTSRTIRQLPPGQCIVELACIPSCKALIKDLVAAEEIGADILIEEVFLFMKQSEK